jgi:hypothetical protein
LLTAAKMPFVEALPGVGENLGNDGVVIATMEGQFDCYIYVRYR